MRNWGGNYTYRAGRLHRPATLDELRRIVARAPRIRVLGARHAFSNIADSAELVTLDALPADVVVNRDAGTVSLGAGMTYGALATALACEHLALANLASSPQIAVGGAIATATHGSGDASGNLATAVAGMELVTSAGEAVTVRRGDADFEGLVVGLGATGVVTRVFLDVEPAYEVSQRVFEGLGWDVLFEQFDAVFASGDSVSLFTRWGDAVDQLWVKRRVTGAPDRAGDDLFGARPAASDRHPIPGMDPVAAPHSSAGRARGRNGCRTSGSASRRARVRRSSRSTTWSGAMPGRRSRRCAAWPARSVRCCTSARSARSRRIDCG